MAVAWPSTLPEYPGTFGEQDRPVTIRSDNSVGPSKQRRRYTKAVTTCQMSFLMTIDEAAIFKALYKNDAQGGAVKIAFNHPWLGTPKDMFVVEEPTYASEGTLGVSVHIVAEYF